MTSSTVLIQPLVALILWSFLMWLWMYATRIPAISRMKIKMDPNIPSATQMAQLPANVRWKADNYNHLMEQPTVFYALVLALTVLGETSTTAIYAAWSYVILRIIHSLVQAIGNNIIRRFGVFVLSNIPLTALMIFAIKATY